VDFSQSSHHISFSSAWYACFSAAALRGSGILKYGGRESVGLE